MAHRTKKKRSRETPWNHGKLSSHLKFASWPNAKIVVANCFSRRSPRNFFKQMEFHTTKNHLAYILFNYKATFSLVNKRSSAPSKIPPIGKWPLLWICSMRRNFPRCQSIKALLTQSLCCLWGSPLSQPRSRTPFKSLWFCFEHEHEMLELISHFKITDFFLPFAKL